MRNLEEKIFENYSFYPSNMPNYQQISDEETLFWEFVRDLNQIKERALLLGSKGRDAGDEAKQAVLEELKKKGVTIRRGSEYYMIAMLGMEASEENREFEKMVRDLYNYDGKYKEEEYTSLAWPIDELAKDPFLALVLWDRAFQIFMPIPPKGSKTVRYDFFPSASRAFVESSIYLLCTLIPGAWASNRNPLTTSDVLYESFYREVLAAWNLEQTYPPVRESLNEVAPRFSDRKGLVLRNALYLKKLNWNKPFFLPSKTIAQVFERHVKALGKTVSPDTINIIAKRLFKLASAREKCDYLFPFIATKLFSQLFLETGDLSEEEILNLLEDKIMSYTPYKRLVSHNQVKEEAQLKPNDFGDERNHPLITFMQDITSEIYKCNLVRKKVTEEDIVDQVNTNWLALYYYSDRRFIENSRVFALYSDLTLPFMLFYLFWDDDGEMNLDMGWIERLAGVQDISMNQKTKKAILGAAHSDCLLGFDEGGAEWGMQLGRYLFDPDVWDDSGLIAENEQFRERIELVSELSDTLQDILTKNKDNTTVGDATRYACFHWFFDEIFDDLRHFLETLVFLEATRYYSRTLFGKAKNPEKSAYTEIWARLDEQDEDEQEETDD